MTLQEWGQKWGVTPREYPRGGVQMMDVDLNATSKWELYHLSDYYVSGAFSGPSYVLYRR